jgi:serine phosphatase RsbU (regulator of sigma subunit)
MLRAAATDEEHLRLMRELGMVSAMVVPLTARGRQMGAMTLVAAESDLHFDEGDLQLAMDLARRAALAVDNATLYAREHEAAVTLQNALLPQRLPSVAGFEFAARYEPATSGLEVGGDWYEVVALENGSVAVTIGDVAGRGIPAAAVMGRMRFALRAYVVDGYGPSDALGRLDSLIKESEQPEMATIFHLQISADGRQAEYVRAGHPPALLRRPDGSVTTLAGGGTPPLGILRDVECCPHRLELEPGSALLLYTDGLVERRDRDLNAGIDWLGELFARAPRAADECASFLVEQAQVASIPDDVAILVVGVGTG